jgi:predicted TIM-barrel fold metal-dependent hydrolase
MIIDSHAHLLSPKFVHKSYQDGSVKIFSSLSGRRSEIVEKRLSELWDETGALLIQDMDNAGIDQTWISVLDLGLALGEAEYSVFELNRLYAQVAQRYKGRIIAFAGIDPRRENAAELLKIFVREWGLKGLKLNPACGFYPNSENCYELYKIAMTLGIPVLVHTGPEIAPLYSKYCYPVYLDEVANDFPDLTLILAHAGFCWWPEALNIASTKPNIYLDLAGWQPRLHRNSVYEFYVPLRTILDTIGPSRVLFGSDWPVLRLFQGGQFNWVKAFTDSPNTCEKSGINFSRDEIDAILGGNAARLMNERR